MLKTNTLGALAAAAGALVAVGLVMLMVLVVDVQPAEATFAGKNGNIAYSSLDGTDFEIYTIPPTGGTPTRLTNNGVDDSRPAYSPDGTKIAFISDRDGNKEIYVMDAADRDGDGNGDNLTRLTNNAATDQDPAYSPDGTRIAFETLRDSNKEIYMMDAADRDGDGNGDNLTRLTNNAATDRYPDWGPLADVSPPRVTSTIPNATGVAPTTNVKATFSEAMDASTTDGDPSTITATTFMLFTNGSTTKVAAKVSYDSSTRTAKLNPNNNLRRGVTYRAVLTTGVQDVAGNPLAQQIEWLFTVKR